MPFEEYDRKPAQGKTHNTEPKVSIRQTNSIGINKAALDKHTDDETHVKLLFNEDERLLGIKPVESLNNNPNAYTISQGDDSGGGTVTPTSFLRHYDLIHENTIHYEAQWDDDREMIVVDITNEITKYGCREVPTTDTKSPSE